MSVIKEFKEFALKGNVIDLAVGVIIGAAFGKIVTSVVDDIFMPVLGVLVGRHDFSNYFVTLRGSGHFETLAQAKAAGAATLNYGLFMNALFQFLLVSVAMFVVIRQVNRVTRKQAAVATPATRDCPQCLSPVPRAATRCRFCTQPL